MEVNGRHPLNGGHLGLHTLGTITPCPAPGRKGQGTIKSPEMAYRERSLGVKRSPLYGQVVGLNPPEM